MLELKLLKKEDLQKHYVFLQMPRAMIEKEIADFKLSISEKFLYVLMLDRISLSAKNNWVNENGEVYMFYTLDEIAQQMECSKTTAKKNLDGLVAKNFVVKENRGVGKANRIYLGNICPLCEMYNKSDDKKIVNNEPIINEEVKKVDNNLNTTNFQQTAQTQTQQITGIDTAVLEKVIATVTREVMKNMGFNGNTEVPQNEVQKVTKVEIKVSEPKEPQQVVQTQTVTEPKKSMDIEKIKVEVREKIAEEKGLPKAYMNNKTMMNLAIKDMIDFDGTVAINDLLCKNKPTKLNKKYMSTLNLFCDALNEMLINKGVMQLGGMSITADEIYNKLQEYISYSDFYKRYMIKDIDGDVQGNFNKALDKTIIKNRMKYMQTCIWNTLLNLADEMEITMAKLDEDIKRLKNKYSSINTEKVVIEVVENKSDDEQQEQQEQAERNKFYEEFAIRWNKLVEIDGLTDANKSQLNMLYRKFSSDIILETVDKVLEDKSILNDLEIHQFVWEFDKLKVA